MGILTPGRVGHADTINRFVRSATCEYMAEKNGAPEDRFLDLYRRLAAGRIGVVITGFSYVLENGRSTPGQSGIHTDELIPAWKRVTALFSDSPSLLLLQIVHGGRQVRMKDNPGPVWAPSAVPCPASKTVPKEMTAEEIEILIRAFVDAARRAREAGFDGVQLHLAHGYLLSQFMSPYTNRRTDRYGGDQRKRTRIAADILRLIREEVGPDFIVAAKINAEDCLGGGLILNQAVISSIVLEKAGIDLLEVSGGMAESTLGAVRKDIKTLDDEGYYRYHAGAIRRSVDIPVAAVGGFRSLDLMEETIQAGDADFISLARPFVRQPDLVTKFSDGLSRRADCISCNRCFNPRGLRCFHLD